MRVLRRRDITLTGGILPRRLLTALRPAAVVVVSAEAARSTVRVLQRRRVLVQLPTNSAHVTATSPTFSRQVVSRKMSFVLTTIQPEVAAHCADVLELPARLVAAGDEAADGDEEDEQEEADGAGADAHQHRRVHALLAVVEVLQQQRVAAAAT